LGCPEVIFKNPLETPYWVVQVANTQNPIPSPVTGQTPLCTVEGGYQGTTHIKYVYVYFSIKRGKFIKPMRVSGDRVVGNYIYELFPGQYALVGYDSRSKEEPPRTVIAQLITIDNECKEHYGDATIVRF